MCFATLDNLQPCTPAIISQVRVPAPRVRGPPSSYQMSPSLYQMAAQVLSSLELGAAFQPQGSSSHLATARPCLLSSFPRGFGPAPFPLSYHAARQNASRPDVPCPGARSRGLAPGMACAYQRHFSLSESHRLPAAACNDCKPSTQKKAQKPKGNKKAQIATTAGAARWSE